MRLFDSMLMIPYCQQKVGYNIWAAVLVVFVAPVVAVELWLFVVERKVGQNFGTGPRLVVLGMQP